jgi:prophage tail gpP-like protein
MSEYAQVVITPRDGSPAFSPRWTRVYVRKSLDEICSYIEVETSPLDRTKIRAHDGIQVRYTNDYMQKQQDPRQQSRPVATGFIDEIDLEISAKRRSLVVNGRSAARDIIDSSWSGSISNQTLLAVVREIAKPDGVNVWHMPTTVNKVPFDGTKLVTDFSWENESPWQKLIQEADNQGYLITSNQLGELYVWPVASGSRPEPFSLEEGSGIISIKDHESGAEQFNTYVFKGDSKEVTKYDTGCRTKRRLTVNLTGKTMDDAALDRRIKTEMLRRRNRRITIGLYRWGLAEPVLEKMGDINQKEVLWEINFFAPVKMPSLDINARMLVSQVEYRADPKALSCEVQLSNPEAYR